MEVMVVRSVLEILGLQPTVPIPRCLGQGGLVGEGCCRA